MTSLNLKSKLAGIGGGWVRKVSPALITQLMYSRLVDRSDTNGMGLVTMSERDLKRIQVLTEVLAGRRTVVSAAAVLALGVRQTFRLLARYQDDCCT